MHNKNNFSWERSLLHAAHYLLDFVGNIQVVLGGVQLRKTLEVSFDLFLLDVDLLQVILEN